MKHYRHRTIESKITIGGRYKKSIDPDYRPDFFWTQLRNRLITATTDAVLAKRDPNQTARKVCAKAKEEWDGKLQLK